MLVDNGFSFRRAHEIEAAILAAAALAADGRNDVSLPAHANRKGSQTEVKTALWALSTVIFALVVIIVVAMNVAGRKKEVER